MDVDALIARLGGFGRYQRLKYILLMLYCVFDGLQNCVIVIVAAKSEFECKLGPHNHSGIFPNITPSDLRELSYASGDSCKILNASVVSKALYLVGGNVSDAKDVLQKNYLPEKCPNGFNFLPGQYKTSIASEFELVCDREILRTTAQASYFVGKLIGLIITGRLSDRFGRKKVFIASVIFTAVFGLGAAAAPNVYVFYCCLVLYGSLGAFYVGFTMATELVGPKHRAVISTGLNLSANVGYALLAPLAYFVQNWRYLLIVINAPCLLVIGYWCVFDESLRWLLVKDKDGEAQEILEKIAYKNKVTLPEDTIMQVKKGLLKVKENDNKPKFSIIDLCRDKRIVLITLAIWFNWLTNALLYYGLLFNIDSLLGNMYVNLTILALCSIGGAIICMFLANKIGRKMLIIASLLIAGTSSLVGGLLRDDEMLVVLTMIGKLAISTSFSTIYLVTAEIFPTDMRNLAITGSAVVSRVGSMAAPFIIQLQTIWASLPFVILGIGALLAAASTLLYPETSGKSLPQTIEELIIVRGSREVDCDTEKKDAHV